MLISDLMQSRGITAVTTGKVGGFPSVQGTESLPQNSGFAKELQNQLDEKRRTEQNSGGVVFSKHALERISERQIDIENGDTLERLNKAVELAGEKGSNDALVMIGSNAFIVSIKNNKVITTLSADDMQGNIFTNIDSTVIM
ncbi:MAG: TIGR02530 family flagellar biosynthesis protein [Oscillospiraceae bacterium]